MYCVERALSMEGARKGGRLLFDDDGNPKSVGPLRKPDVSSMLDRQRTGDLDNFFRLL